jgi:hypothetical protein
MSNLTNGVIETIRRGSLVVVVLLLALPSLSCRKVVSVHFQECTSPRGDTAICLIVEVDFSSAGSIHAGTLYQTREVNPNYLGPEWLATPTGVLDLKLDSGQTVRHTGSLYLDAGTQPPPIRSGSTVLSYRPSNPAALQGFIDAHRSEATSAKLTVTVMLRDVSGGMGGQTFVDVQGNHGSTREYLGTVGGSLPDISPENQDY